MHIGHLSEKVWENYAYLGVAYDGDTDRVLFCDNAGRLIDGDIMLWIIARYLASKDELGSGVVATVMSNMILEEKLAEEGIKVFRCPVGDRYVLEKMQESGAMLGGEQSGHVVLSDFATTGDGLLAALQVLACIRQSGRPASEVLRVFTPLPQLLKNVRYDAGGVRPLEMEGVKAAIRAGEAKLAGAGRVLIRKSGTEPLIRVMAEGEDEALVAHVVDDICEAVRVVTRAVAAE